MEVYGVIVTLLLFNFLDTYKSIGIPDPKSVPPNNITKRISQLTQVKICSRRWKIKCQQATDVSKKVIQFLKERGVKKAANFNSVVKVVEKLLLWLRKGNQARQIYSDMVEIPSELLNVDKGIVSESQLKYNSSTRILQSLDKLATLIGQRLPKINDFLFETTENIAFTVAKVAKDKDVHVVGLQTSNKSIHIVITTHPTTDLKPSAEIIIPKEAVAKSGVNHVFSFCFRYPNFFYNQKHLKKYTGLNVSIDRGIATNVFSASIANTIVRNLQSPVVVTFKRHENLTGNEACQFWDFETEDWSTKGCKVVKSINENFTRCECNHLTNFALIFNLHGKFYNPLELQIVSWIGCGISIGALTLTIAIFIFFRKFRSNLPSKILISLCLSLFILLIIFLVGVEETSNKRICQGVAALLQYFVLTTIFWNGVEGFNLYRNFVNVFKDTEENTIFKRMCIFAWGLPAVIVGITVAVDRGKLGNNKTCIVHGSSFYYGLLMPVCVVLLFNWIMLILTMHGIRSSSLRSNNKTYRRMFWQISLVATILGLTWTFAVLAVGNLREIFQWLFCIFNSMQGFIIFLLFVSGNEEKRKLLLNALQLNKLGNKSSQGNRETIETNSTHI